MKELVLAYLNKHTKKQFSLLELQQNLPGNAIYEQLVDVIEEYVVQELLIPVYKSGQNGKSRPLYNTYRINRNLLKKDFAIELHEWQRKVASSIDLSAYLMLPEKEWKRDLASIELINNYITKEGLPLVESTIPERSYKITQNEKWIESGEGKRVLERLKLWEKMKIITQPEPLMLAVNPKGILEKKHLHLIVENKSTYYMLLGLLKNTLFTSLVYGAGWKVVGNIEGLYKQLGLEGEVHECYYFGDIDYEGIAIYNSLPRNYEIKVATTFYECLLTGEPTFGKANQKRREEAVTQFLSAFSGMNQEKMRGLLERGYYYPQEALLSDKALMAWRGLQ